MTSRPNFVSKRRPLSAIFIGSNSSSPNLPDLPEPPSPGASSNASGLPSPPATNSTGSGSTGEKSSNDGSIRRRSVSNTVAGDMQSGNQGSSRGSRTSSPDEDDDGEDRTARLNKGRRVSGQTSSENARALERVMSLTQRNRLVCADASSYHSVLKQAHRPSTNSPPCLASIRPPQRPLELQILVHPFLLLAAPLPPAVPPRLVYLLIHTHNPFPLVVTEKVPRPVPKLNARAIVPTLTPPTTRPPLHHPHFLSRLQLQVCDNATYLFLRNPLTAQVVGNRHTAHKEPRENERP